MRKLVSMLAITALTVSTLVGCGGGSAANTSSNGSGSAASGTADTIVFGQSADPRGLDPALVDDGESSKIIVNVYEGLLQYKEDSTEIEPCLAKSWDISDDGKEYTFHLQEGVKFQDGTDFNAEAVKFNIERQTINKTADMSYGDFVYGQVEKVEVVDELTVKVTLDSACTPFLANLAMSLGAPMVSPTACKNANNNLNEAPCGTGPYKFVRWDKGESVVLERNEDYWGEKAATKNVIFKFITDNSARVVALTNGEVDMIDGIDNTVVDQIKNAGYTVNSAEGMNINYLSYNVEKLTDADVRKALSQAVNVPELVQSLYGGYATEATTILPTFMSGYSDKVTQAAYDPEAAKATLQAKGVTQIHMITYSNARPYNTATGQKLAEAIQGYYEKVGVKVTLDSYDWTTYKDKAAAGDFDVAFYGWNGDNGDPDNFLNILASEEWSMNVSRYQNKEYNDLLSKAVAMPNGEERNAVYGQMEQKVADEAIWLPISHAQSLSANSPKVNNFIYHQTGNVFLKKVTKSN